jgi:hypothetical protein
MFPYARRGLHRLTVTHFGIESVLRPTERHPPDVIGLTHCLDLGKLSLDLFPTRER